MIWRKILIYLGSMFLEEKKESCSRANVSWTAIDYNDGAKER